MFSKVHETIFLWIFLPFFHDQSIKILFHLETLTLLSFWIHHFTCCYTDFHFRSGFGLLWLCKSSCIHPKYQNKQRIHNRTLEVMINISNFNKNSAFGIILYLIEKKKPKWTWEEQNSGLQICSCLTVEKTSMLPSMCSCCIQLWIAQNIPQSSAPSLKIKLRKMCGQIIPQMYLITSRNNLCSNL